MSHDDLLSQLSQAQNVETIDLGAVNLHLAVINGQSHVLVENPMDSEQCAKVTVPV
jgi:hypothetical protein